MWNATVVSKTKTQDPLQISKTKTLSENFRKFLVWHYGRKGVKTLCLTQKQGKVSLFQQ